MGDSRLWEDAPGLRPRVVITQGPGPRLWVNPRIRAGSLRLRAGAVWRRPQQISRSHLFKFIVNRPKGGKYVFQRKGEVVGRLRVP